MHQTMANQLRPILMQNPPQSLHEAENLVDAMLANTVYALGTAVHTALQSSPAAIAFGRDMIFNVPFIANLQTMKTPRESITIIKLDNKFSWPFRIIKKFRSFHARVARYITGRHIRELEDGTYFCPPTVEVLNEAGTHTHTRHSL